MTQQKQLHSQGYWRTVGPFDAPANYSKILQHVNSIFGCNSPEGSEAFQVQKDQQRNLLMCQKLLQAIAWTARNDATNQHTPQEFMSMSCNVTQLELVAQVKIMPRSKTARSFSLVWLKLANRWEASCTSPAKLPEKVEGLGTRLKTCTHV